MPELGIKSPVKGNTVEKAERTVLDRKAALAPTAGGIIIARIAKGEATIPKKRGGWKFGESPWL